MAQWRRFPFFEKELIKDLETGKAWCGGISISCMDAKRGVLGIGDHDGRIHLANGKFEIHTTFKAYEHFVSHILLLSDVNLMVTAGDGIMDPLRRKKDKNNSTALVKIWRTDQMAHEGGELKMLQQLRVFAKYPEEAITSFDVSRDLSHIAIGLQNGAVILFRSDLGKKGEQKPPVLIQAAGGAGSHQSSSSHAVTYLAFAETQPDKKLYLYTGTKTRGLVSYLCYPEMLPPSNPNPSTVLDERGINPNVAAVNDQGELAVGQPDAVYFFTPEDRGICFGFDGEKSYLSFFKHYLIVSHVDARNRTQVNVYDLKNKFIAYNWTLLAKNEGEKSKRSSSSSVVSHVVSEFGSIIVATAAGNIYRLTEKDTTSKLEILYRKNLYAIAISLAFSANVDINNIVNIFRMYGDYLYKKGDFDGSVTQYSRTIGHIEPSYVIRRFLDAQRIRNLTSYLEALHTKSFANSEHTTLLLNCYTKLKDVEKLDAFIGRPTGDADRSSGVSSSDGTTNTSTIKLSSHEQDSTPQQPKCPIYSLTFDVETAISVLRTSYPEHALRLAKSHGEHSWYLKIQLEHISYVDNTELLKEADMNRVQDSLAYIKSLEFADADNSLKKYGRTLVTHLPEETTRVLKLLCTGRYVPEINVIDRNSTSNDVQASSSSGALKSDPADFIHLYVAHPKHLREFMEYIVAEAPAESLSASIGNTLLDLLLQSDDENIDDDKAREDAVMKLLDNPQVSYDDDHALILVQMHGMKRGQRYLYSKLHMYQTLVQHHMENQDDSLVLAEVKKHGDKDVNLWLMALKYFSQRASSSKSSSKFEELKQVLKIICERHPSIPTLQVIQILSSKKNLPLSIVKPFLMHRLTLDDKVIAEDREEISKFKADTRRMKTEIRDIQQKAIVFKTTRCELCNHDLDPPSVHFKCRHSFHQGCIPENEFECTTCAPEHRHILNLKASLESKALNHEQFFNQLESSVDGFHTVAEYFGKGIFDIKN